MSTNNHKRIKPCTAFIEDILKLLIIYFFSKLIAYEKTKTE